MPNPSLDRFKHVQVNLRRAEKPMHAGMRAVISHRTLAYISEVDKMHRLNILVTDRMDPRSRIVRPILQARDADHHPEAVQANLP
jgi:hypothetical protein